MIRLLFISHTGNNEPPMAQCIMDHLIQKAGLTDSLSVSAASFAKEGAPLSKAAQETLSAHGIPYTMKKTFPIAWKAYDDYDFILLMNDKNNPDIFNTLLQVSAMLAAKCGDARSLAQIQMLAQQSNVQMPTVQVTGMPAEEPVNGREHAQVSNARAQTREAAMPDGGAAT